MLQSEMFIFFQLGVLNGNTVDLHYRLDWTTQLKSRIQSDFSSNNIVLMYQSTNYETNTCVYLAWLTNDNKKLTTSQSKGYSNVKHEALKVCESG